MLFLRVKANVNDDRRVVLTLPPEVPTGWAELLISVESPQPTKKHPRTRGHHSTSFLLNDFPTRSVRGAGRKDRR